VIEALDRPTTLAMTATASNEVRDEIVQKLGLRSPRIFVHDFDRPNIYLRVDSFARPSEKFDAVLRRVEFADKVPFSITAALSPGSAMKSRTALWPAKFP
jgi:ATP-dependent DNA helicase RecQ